MFLCGLMRSLKSSLETIRLFRDLLFAKMFYCHIILNMINLSWNPTRFMSIVLLRTRTNEWYTELCSANCVVRSFIRSFGKRRQKKNIHATTKLCVHDTKNKRKMPPQARYGFAQSENIFELDSLNHYPVRLVRSVVQLFVCSMFVSAWEFSMGIEEKRSVRRMPQKLTCPIGKSMSRAPYPTLYRVLAKYFRC